MSHCFCRNSVEFAKIVSPKSVDSEFPDFKKRQRSSDEAKENYIDTGFLCNCAVLYQGICGELYSHCFSLIESSFCTPAKKMLPLENQINISTPSTPFRSKSGPIAGSAKKTRKDVSRLGETQLSMATVAKAVTGSLKGQGLGEHVVQTVMDVVTSDLEVERNTATSFVAAATGVTKRTVERKLSIGAKCELSPPRMDTSSYSILSLSSDTPRSQVSDSITFDPAVHLSNAPKLPSNSTALRNVTPTRNCTLRLVGGARRVGRKKRRTLEEIKASGDAEHPKLAAFLDSLERISNVRSGSDGERHFRRATWRSAYVDYLEDLRQHGEEIGGQVPSLGFPAFCTWSRRWHIRLFRHDRYACPHCEKVSSGQLSPNDPGYTQHRFVVEGMKQVYDSVRCSLAGPDTVLVIIDYCRHHTIQAISVDSHEKQKRDPSKFKKKSEKTSHFSATIVTAPFTEVGQCTDVHLDLIGQVKQGPSFMDAGIKIVTEYLLQHCAERTKVHFFADGGLRSWGTLECISQLSLSLGSVPVRTLLRLLPWSQSM